MVHWTKVILCLILLPLTAGAVSVSQSVDQTEIPFEGRATLTIRVSWDGSPSALLFEHALRLEADKLKVASFSSRVTSTGSGADEVTTKEYTCVLEPTLSGLATVESAAIEYVSRADSLPGVLMTDPVEITIAEPRPQIVESSSNLTIYVTVGVCLVGAVGAILLVVLVRRKRPVADRNTPAESFLEALDAIKSESGNDLKHFQTGLQKHLLTFLSVRYHLNISGRTTEDIVADLPGTGLSESEQAAIAGWLTRAEKEKYIPVEAAPGEVIRLASEIRAVFERMS